MMGRSAVRILGAGALLLAVCNTNPALAQSGRGGQPSIGRPVVQPLGTAQLNEALARLASNPQDVDALLDAANSALQLGDIEAAIGFLTRADTVSPANPRVKAMIGSALVRNENPYDAIGYFDQAEATGADVSRLASDRGLAFDLVGDQQSAQAFYRIAMARAPSEETTRRYALSLAVSGDRRGADSLLSPLIQRQDPAAWRTRTFILAITGQQDEAISVANAMMPKSLADGIAPYLRYMPRLTPAQQVAAATFGKFPRAADIGRDDPRAARFAEGAARRVASLDAALVPVGEPLGSKNPPVKDNGKDKRRRPGNDDPVRVAEGTARASTALRPATSPATPAVATTAPRGAVEAAPVQAERSVTNARPVPAQSASAAPVFPAPQSPAAAPQAAPVSVTGQMVRPGVARVEAAPQVAPQPAPVDVVPAPSSVAPVRTAQAPEAEADFGALFGNFRAPADEVGSSPVAVDITRIAPSRPQPAKPKMAEVKTAANGGQKAETPPVDTVARAARGARPDGPTDVARVTRADTARLAGEKSLATKAGAKGLAAKDETAKGASAKGTPTKGAVAKGEVAKGEVGKTGKVAAAKGAADKSASAKAEDAKGKTKGKAKQPANPERIWVQLSTGGNREALPADWRRIVRSAPDALRGKKAYVTAWRSNFRLLTGPFETDAAARAFLNQLRRADVAAFSWTSPEGQAVEALPTGR